MTSRDIVTAVVALTVPLVAAIAAALGIVFQDWRTRRQRDVRRRTVLEEAGKQLSFVAEWWKIRELIDDPGNLAAAKSTAGVLVADAVSMVAQKPPPPSRDAGRMMRRRLLLLYPFTRRSAEVIRVFFYVALVVLARAAGNAVADSLNPSGRRQAVGDLTAVSVVATIAFALRFWAEQVEQSASGSVPARSSTITQILLLYRVRRPAGRVVKAGFIVLLCVVVVVARLEVDDVRANRWWLIPDVATLVALLCCAAAMSAWVRCIEPHVAGAPPGPVRRALLLYRMRHRGAVALRVLSYVWVVVMGAGALGYVGVHRPREFVLESVTLLTPVIGLHLWATALDTGGFPEKPGSVRRTLLLYPLRRRGARIARALAYLVIFPDALVLPSEIVFFADFIRDPLELPAFLALLGGAVLLRFWAVRIECRPTRRTPPRAGSRTPARTSPPR